MILPKGDAAFYTLIGADLTGITGFADNFFDQKSVHWTMGIICQLIVADATPVNFTAARSDDVALSLIMNTWDHTTSCNGNLKGLYIILANFTVGSS